MYYFILATLFGLLNIVSTKSTMFSLLLCAAEYSIIYFYLVKGNKFKSFLFYLLFTSVSLEMDYYVYGEEIPFLRYSFFNVPFIHDWFYNITTVLFFILVFIRSNIVYNRDIKKFSKWLIVLLFFGTLSIILGMIFNDNRIISSGLYPKNAFSTIMRYVFLCMFFYICIYFASIQKYRTKLVQVAISFLLGIILSSIIGILLGYNAHYGWNDAMLLSPMVFAFTPCVMMFFDKNKKKSYVYLFFGILVVFVAFYYPCVVGSKWYLIIAATLFFIVYNNLKALQSGWSILFLAILFLLLVPVATSFLGTLISQDDFNSWKFYQALGALDLFSHDSFEDWFYALDDSAQFRIDEIINISIEYLNKPFYFLFGKGLGGTTLHYTNFINLDWSADASFTQEQVQNGFFFQMHESTGLIYLRHGILGIIFMIWVIVKLIKKMKDNPWAMMGLLWFIFYWGFCVSFRLGALAIVLALTNEKQNDNKSERITVYE